MSKPEDTNTRTEPGSDSRAPTGFPGAREDAGTAEQHLPTAEPHRSSHRLAYADMDFLMRDELRGVRLQLEFEKPDLVQEEHGISDTVVIFGSTRVPEEGVAQQRLAEAEQAAAADPDDESLAYAVTVARSILDKVHFYEAARSLARHITEAGMKDPEGGLTVVTGGGPGIMEAANRGAHEAGGKSIGLNIVLPHEQRPNDYITPELCFQFHYFAIRKLHFLLRARVLVVFPGGFGTLDELFETLTLIQTRKARPLTVLLFGEAYWRRIINFEALAEEGTIHPDDLALFQFCDSADEAWRIIKAAHAGSG
ncbi:MAG: TIGR00730 family Rossman fold protein [Halieaceae bacterium]|jgi:uncharacterized protein (TIGR00730 family)|nr:TIGR00730 family Rossman fold protein [Halieaceae bacterium]